MVDIYQSDAYLRHFVEWEFLGGADSRSHAAIWARGRARNPARRVCRITGGELRAGDDVCAVNWVRRVDLPKLRITEGALAVIEKGLRERGKYR